MTESNGSVGIRVQVPVLGTVTGARSLSDIVAGRPIELPTEQPAVAVRDLPGATPVAVAPTPVATAPPAGGDPPPAVTPEPTKPTTPATTPPAAEDDEAKANKLFQFATNYINVGMKAKGISNLKDIVAKYPKTEAAQQAKEKLAELGE